MTLLQHFLGAAGGQCLHNISEGRGQSVLLLWLTLPKCDLQCVSGDAQQRQGWAWADPAPSCSVPVGHHVKGNITAQSWVYQAPH